MKCQRCASERLARVNAKCSDRCVFTPEQGEHDLIGYVPFHVGIGGGDYIQFKYCLDCGQIQGDFPLPRVEDENEQV